VAEELAVKGLTSNETGGASGKFNGKLNYLNEKTLMLDS
jgi:hypothetical protein